MVAGQDDPPADPPLIDLWQQSYAEVAGGCNSLLDGATHVYIQRVPWERKVLLLQLGDRQEWVLADRLKPHAGGRL